MSTTTRLAGFALVLALLFGAGWAVGAAVGPIDGGSAGAPAASTTTTAVAHTGGHS